MGIKIMTFFTENRAQLALDRTQKNFDDAGKYVSKHPIEASLLVAGLVVAAVFFPAPVILALCVCALALICLNLIKEPNMYENMTGLFNS
jgi:hypothetical protein